MANNLRLPTKDADQQNSGIHNEIFLFIFTITLVFKFLFILLILLYYLWIRHNVFIFRVVELMR